MEKIGLIVGTGDLPLYFLKKAVEKNIEVYPLGIFENINESVKKHANFKSFNLSDVRNIIGYFLLNGVKNVCMLGNVDKKIIFNDEKVKKVMDDNFSNISDNKDSTLISSIISLFSLSGLNVIPQNSLLEDLMVKNRNYTKITPTENDEKTIELGIKAAEFLTSLDIGQTVVCKDKSVVALEGIEGTDETIKRAGSLAGEGVIVVKLARPNQDLRIDIPTIGIETINNMIKIKAKGLVCQSEKMLFLDEEEVIRLADENSIFIVGK